MPRKLKIIFAVIVGLIVNFIAIDYFVYTNTNENIVFFIDYFPLRLLFAMLEFYIGISLFALILLLINFMITKKINISKTLFCTVSGISIIILIIVYFIFKISTKDAIQQMFDESIRYGHLRGWLDPTLQPHPMLNFISLIL